MTRQVQQPGTIPSVGGRPSELVERHLPDREDATSTVIKKLVQRGYCSFRALRPQHVQATLNVLRVYTQLRAQYGPSPIRESARRDQVDARPIDSRWQEVNRSKANVAVSDGFMALTHQLRMQGLVLGWDPWLSAPERCVARKQTPVSGNERTEGDEPAVLLFVTGMAKREPRAQCRDDVLVPDRPQAKVAFQPVLLALPSICVVHTSHSQIVAAQHPTTISSETSTGAPPPRAPSGRPATRRPCAGPGPCSRAARAGSGPHRR